MRPCPNPLIRIIIDDEDGELPSIDISAPTEGEDYHQNEEESQRGHEDTESEDGEHFGESLSSSVDSYIHHLDSLHPYRFTSVF